MDLCELETSLVYRGSSKTVRPTPPRGGEYTVISSSVYHTRTRHKLPAEHQPSPKPSVWPGVFMLGSHNPKSPDASHGPRPHLQIGTQSPGNDRQRGQMAEQDPGCFNFISVNKIP